MRHGCPIMAPPDCGNAPVTGAYREPAAASACSRVVISTLTVRLASLEDAAPITLLARPVSVSHVARAVSTPPLLPAKRTAPSDAHAAHTATTGPMVGLRADPAGAAA